MTTPSCHAQLAVAVAPPLPPQVYLRPCLLELHFAWLPHLPSSRRAARTTIERDIHSVTAIAVMPVVLLLQPQRQQHAACAVAQGLPVVYVEVEVWWWSMMPMLSIRAGVPKTLTRRRVSRCHAHAVAPVLASGHPPQHARPSTTVQSPWHGYQLPVVIGDNM